MYDQERMHLKQTFRLSSSSNDVAHTSAHGATNPLGRIRIEMEDSYRRSDVQTIILRAGDFIDTEASGNWLDKVMLPGLARGKFTYPGRPDVPHAWAYLPDLARAAVELAESRRELDQFTDVPFDGYTLTGQQICDMLADLTQTRLRLRPVPWWAIRAASPVWPMGRCLQEMRYLWDLPHRLDGSRLAQLCPLFRPTPVGEALAVASAPFRPQGTQPPQRVSSCRSTQTSL